MTRNLRLSGFINAACLLALAICLSSCVMYNEEKEGKTVPAYDTFKMLYSDNVAHIFRAAELCSFFDNYQKIRTDRDASEALARGYFGSFESLYYEMAWIPGWGTINYISDGVYGINLDNMLLDSNYETEYMAVKREDGRFQLYQQADLHQEELSVSIIGKQLCIESFSMSYTDSHGVSVRMSVESGNGLKMPLCSEGNACYAPESGIIEVSLHGNGVEDDFWIEFEKGLLYLNQPGLTTTLPNMDEYGYMKY